MVLKIMFNIWIARQRESVYMHGIQKIKSGKNIIET